MRSRSSVYNSILRLIASVLPNILGLYLNNLLLNKFGSDMNGVTATIGQVLTLFTLFEGGFTLASNVALYKPFLDNNYHQINRILSATRELYIKVGYIVLVLTILTTFVVPKVIITGLKDSLVSILFLIASINILVNFFYYYKFTIMFAVSQQEYKLVFYNIGFTILSQLLAILVFYLNADIIEIKLLTMVIPMLGYPFVVRQHNRYFPEVNFKTKEPDFQILESSKDVLVQKITSLVFSSTDMVLLSIFVSTLITSVYAVYNMIFLFIKNLLFSIILAPFNAFGQLLAESNNEKSLSENYKLYSHISITIISVLLTSVLIVALPFVSLYTYNLSDVEYLDHGIAILFGISVFLELISNMTGGLLNSAGKFHEMKSNVLFGAIINALVSVTLVRAYGVKGVLWGTVLAYLVMDILQIRLVFSLLLRTKSTDFIRLIILNIFVCSILLIISRSVNIQFNNYYDFAMKGLVVFLITSILVFTINFIMYRQEFMAILTMVKKVFNQHNNHS